MPKFKSLEVALKLHEILEIKGTWEADEAQQRAAWEVYVELVTRIAVVTLPSGQGLLREALSSLHALFEITRAVLRAGGPTLATPGRKGRLSFGMIAVDVLNRGLRPFLAKWHPALGDWETKRPSGKSAAEHEQEWPQRDIARQELREVQQIMVAYASLLGEAAGVPSLVSDEPTSGGPARR